MYKYHAKYTDYNGQEQEKDFYFNLSRAEVIELELTMPGGMQKYLTMVGSSNNGALIIKTFKEIIFSSYGEKSEDGQLFRKSPTLSENFSASEAYSEFLLKVCTDADFASQFVNNIMPKGDGPSTVERPRVQDHLAPKSVPKREADIPIVQESAVVSQAAGPSDEDIDKARLMGMQLNDYLEWKDWQSKKSAQ